MWWVRQGGGILVNLINRSRGENHLPLAVSIVLATVIILLIQDLRAHDDMACLKKALYPAKVVKVDAGVRVFVVVPKVEVKQLMKSVPKVEECWKQMGWESENWNISYFDQKKYAGYKEDKLDLVDWSDHYLAEYDHEKGILTIYQPGKKVIRIRKK
jgi:hypothetical protein